MGKHFFPSLPYQVGLFPVGLLGACLAECQNKKLGYGDGRASECAGGGIRREEKAEDRKQEYTKCPGKKAGTEITGKDKR